MTRLIVLCALLVACSGQRKEEGKEAPTVEPLPGSGSAAPKPDDKVVARGEYLANMLGCGTCHMAMKDGNPDFSRPYAGGLEIPEVFGTWRSPNITQHKGSGIGGWTDEQIAMAIREGLRPNGDLLYPIMPYLNYNRMTDDDVKALVAFLRTVKPIDNVVAPAKLALPKMSAPKPANEPDVVNDPMKHGEYLVTLMHCNVCHSPMTARGPDMNRQFAGGWEMELEMLGTGTLYGANITSDAETGIGKWSQADVEKAIKTLTRPDGTIIQGPMQFYLMGWSQMKDEDLRAIATFIKAIPPIKNKVSKSKFTPKFTGAGSAAPPTGSAAPTGPTAAPPTGKQR